MSMYEKLSRDKHIWEDITSTKLFRDYGAGVTLGAGVIPKDFNKSSGGYH